MSGELTHVDFESFSEADITEVGAYKYAEDISTFIWCVGYKVGDGPKHFWIPPHFEWPKPLLDRIEERLATWGGKLHYGFRCPADISNALAAHNAGFERTMGNGHPGKAINFPQTDIRQWKCTAAKARASGLPGALGDVAQELKTHPKSKAGRNTMLKLCRPRKPTKDDPNTICLPERYPDDFYELFEYNMDDVEAEYGVDIALPDLTPAEYETWALDQKINDRGVLVDPAYIADAQVIIEEYRREMEKLCLELTGCECLDGHNEKKCRALLPTQRDRIAEWIRTEGGYGALENMQAETVERLCASDSGVPPKAQQMLRLYATYGMKAISKFDVMLAARCNDDRVRGMFIFYGAGTGRWSSVLIQLQNLFRPVIKNVQFAISVIQTRSLALLRAMFL
jgi:DNA polymerase bacteriophage-type